MVKFICYETVKVQVSCRFIKLYSDGKKGFCVVKTCGREGGGVYSPRVEGNMDLG